MGFIDSIKDAASATVRTVTSAVTDPAEAGRKLKRSVEQAPHAISRGASDAIAGARELGTRVAAGTARWAKDGHAALKAGPKETLEFARSSAKSAGTWAWNNKAEIGFWVGTTALMLAIPVSGGASGAAAGGLMAARGAAVAARVATMGKTGAAAVNVAKAAAVSMRGARGAVAASKVGGAAIKTGHAVQSARVALGATRTGKVMLAAAKPVTTASTVLAAANFADTSVKMTRGEADAKDMALATLGFAPTVVGGVRSVAAKRAVSANAQAARAASRSLDAVASKASVATGEASRIARAAPALNAPRTAGAAASTIDEAAEVAAKAQLLQRQAALTARSATADSAIDASTLARNLEEVANQTRTARRLAQSTEELAPTSLSPMARGAARRLQSAEETVEVARQRVATLAQTQRRADKVVTDAAIADKVIGETSSHAFNINNAIAASQEVQPGMSRTDVSLARGIISYLLGKNATMGTPTHAVTPR